MEILNWLFGKKPEPEKERGTVIYQSPEYKVGEVGGITVTSSVFIRKFTEEETRENAKENRWFFEPAYQKVMQMVEADPKRVSSMFDELLVAFTAGDPRREQKVVEQYLPEGTWRWPDYEAWALERDQKCYEEDLEFWKQATLSDLITCLKIGQLRTLYKEFAGNKAASPGRKKADIGNALFHALTPTQKTELAERLRIDAIAALVFPGTPDYREMVVLLCRRIRTVAYWMERRKQMLEIVKLMPMWKFVAGNDFDLPMACKLRDGKLYQPNDPIWNEVLPCGHLECSCRAAPMNRRDIDSSTK